MFSDNNLGDCILFMLDSTKFNHAFLQQFIPMSSPIQNPVSVTADCANGQDIRASYEISYNSSSGTSITSCVVDGTDCSDGVCHHELQDNTTDSRCQPPVHQFISESVTVTVTARNIVGRSNPAASRSIRKFYVAL